MQQLQSLNARLGRGKAINVNDQETKAAVVALASTYFEQVRPYLVERLGETDVITRHDVRWQDLVRLAHGNNARSTYKKTVSSILRECKELSVAELSQTAVTGTPSSVSDLTPAEQQLIETLEALLPSAAASYRQGILDLREGQRLSYRGTASEFREALRETLDHLASDGEVARQPGYNPEPGLKKPTMKQKVRYVMASRGRSTSHVSTVEKSTRGVEDLTAEVMRATYDRASLATHVETNRREVLRIKRYVDTILFDLLEIAER